MSKIQEMFEIQDKLNVSILGENYAEQNVPFYRAAIVEAAELYDHTGYKWWKRNEPFSKKELEQAQLEIVDIWHFLMSDIISSTSSTSSKDSITTSLEYLLGNKKPTKNSKEYKLECIDEFIYSTSKQDIEYIESFVALMFAFDLSLDALYDIYIGKNALNYFRQEHGYKDGTYNKESWLDKNGNEVEDNVVLSEILETEPTSFTEIYTELEKRYEQST